MKVANKIYIAVGLMIVLQLANSIMLISWMVGAVWLVRAIRGPLGVANRLAAGIAQVNHAIASLDQMTQQNAALVEESVAAAQSMHDQAEQLARAVAVFNIQGSGSCMLSIR